MTSGFVRNTMKLPSGQIDYFTAGAGHDVVYLHPASGMRVSTTLVRLAQRFRVWAPIIPGFDGTALHDDIIGMRDLADLLAAFVEDGPGRACDIVGCSLGGWLGAWFAISYPELVENLVLSGPAGLRTADSQPLSFDPEVMRKQLYAQAEMVQQDEKTAKMRVSNGEMVSRYGLATSHDAELQARISEISCQTLILHGTLDVRVPLEGIQMIKAKIPHSQLVYVYGAAHSLELDQPERVSALIEDFLLRGEAFIVNQTLPGAESATTRSAP